MSTKSLLNSLGFPADHMTKNNQDDYGVGQKPKFWGAGGLRNTLEGSDDRLHDAKPTWQASSEALNTSPGRLIETQLKRNSRIKDRLNSNRPFPAYTVDADNTVGSKDSRVPCSRL